MNLEVSGKHKKLTRFICQELLYELLTNRLDPEKRAEMELFLTGDKDSQRELERLDRGMTYAEMARKVKVSPDMRSALEDFEPHWKRAVWKWTAFSSQRGWKLLPYLFVAGALVLGVVVAKPWRSMKSDVVLIEEPKTATVQMMGGPIAPPDIDTGVTPLRPSPLAPPPTFPIAPAEEFSPSPVIARSAPAATESAPVATTQDPAPEPAGWVYRSSIEVGDYTTSWNTIREKIESLGGTPASDADLAVQRKDDVRFHFSLPESKREELLEYLKTFGPVRFSKVHDPRVMPEGEIRIILTVKDNGVHAEPPPPATEQEGTKPSP